MCLDVHQRLWKLDAPCLSNLRSYTVYFCVAYAIRWKYQHSETEYYDLIKEKIEVEIEISTYK